MKPEDKIFEILREKGEAIRQSDMDEIELLIMEADPDVWIERMGWFYEGLALIVNDPNYEGDIAPVD